MAVYTRQNYLAEFPLAWSDVIQWGSVEEAGNNLNILNSDGSYTRIFSNDFVLDSNGIPTSGTVTYIQHERQVDNGGSTTVTLIEYIDVTSSPYDLVALYNDISGGTFPDNVFAGDDTLNGGTEDDLLNGYTGNDTINDTGGDDIIVGGAGNDTLYANGGSDTITGGVGEDTVTYRLNFTATISIDAGDDNDRVVVEGHNYIDPLVDGTVSGGDGTDTLVASRNVSGINFINFENLLVTGNSLIGDYSAPSFDPDELAQFTDIRNVADEGLADPTTGVTIYLRDSGTVDFSSSVATEVDLYAFATSNPNLTVTGHDGADILQFTHVNGYGSATSTVNYFGGDGNDDLGAYFYSGLGATATLHFEGGDGEDNIGISMDADAGTASVTFDGGADDDYIYFHNLSDSSVSGSATGGTGTNTLYAYGDISQVALTLFSTLHVGSTYEILPGDQVVDIPGFVVATASQFALFNEIRSVLDYDLETPTHEVHLTLASAGTVDFSSRIGTQVELIFDGSTGDDTITGHAGIDTIDGGNGTDTVIFSGLLSDYVFTQLSDGSIRVVDQRDGRPDGIDTIRAVEQLQFSDDTVAVGDLDLTAPLAADFHNDGTSDILWRNGFGVLSLWQVDDFASTGAARVGAAGGNWEVIDTADLTGDGRADILWRNDLGTVSIWEMNGAQSVAGHRVGNIAPVWNFEAVADFDGDSDLDILWRNTNGNVAIWEVENTQATGGHVLGNVPTDWDIAGTGDFNGDGTADILWRNGFGVLSLWEMNDFQLATGTRVGAAGGDWQVIDVNDYTGDGQADILWRNAIGTVTVWEMDGAHSVGGHRIGNISPAWHFSASGDYDGDADPDILWRNDNGNVAMWEIENTVAISGHSLGNVPTDWLIVA